MNALLKLKTNADRRTFLQKHGLLRQFIKDAEKVHQLIVDAKSA